MPTTLRLFPVYVPLVLSVRNIFKRENMSLPGKLLGVGDQSHGDQEKDANSLLMELDKGTSVFTCGIEGSATDK